ANFGRGTMCLRSGGVLAEGRWCSADPRQRRAAWLIEGAPNSERAADLDPSARIGAHYPDASRGRPEWMATQGIEDLARARRRHEQHQLPFVGYVQGIQPQQFTSAPNRCAERHGRFFQLD